jgi:LytS/YehU family sensor histidine kinase
VPLARELDLLDRYTTIQRARFGDRLDVRVSVEPLEAREALVPVLILQPLVENAIRHGIAQRARAGRIDVRARRSGGRLILEVQDDGAGPGHGDFREGVGLGNTKARLAALYGGEQSFHLIGDSIGTVARVSLPWQTDDSVTRSV